MGLLREHTDEGLRKPGALYLTPKTEEVLVPVDA